MKANPSLRHALAFGILGGALVFSACGRKETGTTVRINGSDTMLQVGLAWQAAYKQVKPDVIVSMNGEGSGVGIKALINGEIDLAHSSRPIKESEIEQIKEKYSKDPNEIIFGYDRIAVYVHKDNPLDEITMEQLKGIFAEGGQIDDWSAIAPGMSGTIDRCSRSNTSGTYAFFKDAVCGKGVEFKKGATTMTGSAAVVDFVKTHPKAIGYSGMGYKTDDVKWLVVKQDDGTGCDPTGDDYPIARNLYGYTVGEPTGAVKEYIDWCKGDEAQAILEKEKFVPLPPDKRTK
jgi:phosphate transport system substrate-binding protein